MATIQTSRGAITVRDTDELAQMAGAGFLTATEVGQLAQELAQVVDTPATNGGGAGNGDGGDENLVDQIVAIIDAYEKGTAYPLTWQALRALGIENPDAYIQDTRRWKRDQAFGALGGGPSGPDGGGQGTGAGDKSGLNMGMFGAGAAAPNFLDIEVLRELAANDPFKAFGQFFDVNAPQRGGAPASYMYPFLASRAGFGHQLAPFLTGRPQQAGTNVSGLSMGEFLGPTGLGNVPTVQDIFGGLRQAGGGDLTPFQQTEAQQFLGPGGSDLAFSAATKPFVSNWAGEDRRRMMTRWLNQRYNLFREQNPQAGFLPELLRGPLGQVPDIAALLGMT